MLNLFSKIKQWICSHVSTVITVAAVLIVGILALILGGTLAGWDIASALTSGTAILIYIILGALIVCVLCKALLDKLNM
jgi:ABC-type transport system involved in cytochrome c biogenesis permease subunit